MHLFRWGNRHFEKKTVTGGNGRHNCLRSVVLSLISPFQFTDIHA